MSPVRNWATSGRVKIERAKEHIRDFEVGTDAFFDSKPYRVVAQHDTKRRTLYVQLREFERLPLRWSAVVADAVHNLRSSLDILWSHVMNPDSSAPPRKQYFPVLEDAEAYKARRAREVKSRRKLAMDILDATKPYRGGNDTLWALNEIDIRNKHEVLSLAVGTFQEMTVAVFNTWDFPNPDRFVLTPKGSLHVLEDNTPLFEIHPPPGVMDAKVNVKYEITYAVAFGEGEVLEGKPVIEALHEFSELVDGIALAFESAGLLP